MGFRKFATNRWTIALLGLLLLAGAGGWLYRDAALAWYYVFRLTSADDADRAVWVECVAGLDSAVIPRLVDSLKRQDSRVCAGAQAALAAVTARWPANDRRRIELAVLLSEAFARHSLAGQRSVLELQTEWLYRQGPGGLVPAAIPLVPAAGRSADIDVRNRGLLLAAAILLHSQDAEVVGLCRESVRKGLQDPETDNRALAAQLTGRYPFLQLLPQVAPLLDDPEPVVRRSAMLVLGLPVAESAIATDDLLRSLHDGDEDVRRLCEAALRGRGLGNDDIALARLISDSRPSVRLQVLHNLPRASNLEPTVWLRRLSHDQAPAVRAAAVRAAGEHRRIDFADRLGEMAETDPSPTVRQLARYYLSQQTQP